MDYGLRLKYIGRPIYRYVSADGVRNLRKGDIIEVDPSDFSRKKLRYFKVLDE